MRKYVGKYRVSTFYDLATNDFVRNADGTIDQDFDALYIKCYSGKARITHAYNNILEAYISTLGVGHNILKRIYQDYISQDLPVTKRYNKAKDTDYEVFNFEKLYEELEKNGIVSSIEETDEEIIFFFKATDIDNLAVYLKPSTYGASINPFSTKNLPKAKYKIPAKDLEAYKDIIKDIPKEDILKLSHISRKFDKIVSKKKGKDFNLRTSQKKAMLKSKEFYHSIGMWDDYLNFLRGQVKKLYQEGTK